MNPLVSIYRSWNCWKQETKKVVTSSTNLKGSHLQTRSPSTFTLKLPSTQSTINSQENTWWCLEKAEDGELRSAEITDTPEVRIRAWCRALFHACHKFHQFNWKFAGYEPILELNEEEGGYLRVEILRIFRRIRENDQLSLNHFSWGMATYRRTLLSSSKPELSQKTNTEENTMLKMNLANLQLFAHKKVEVQRQTDVICYKQTSGAKAADGQTVTEDLILYRQRGTHIHPVVNVGRGGDDICIVCKLYSTLNVKVTTRNKYQFTQLRNNYHDKTPSQDRFLFLVKMKSFLTFSILIRNIGYRDVENICFIFYKNRLHISTDELRSGWSLISS